MAKRNLFENGTLAEAFGEGPWERAGVGWKLPHHLSTPRPHRLCQCAEMRKKLRRISSVELGYSASHVLAFALTNLEEMAIRIPKETAHLPRGFMRLGQKLGAAGAQHLICSSAAWLPDRHAMADRRAIGGRNERRGRLVRRTERTYTAPVASSTATQMVVRCNGASGRSLVSILIE